MEDDDDGFDAERMGTDEASIECPFCGETFTVVVDTSIDAQTYVEDCYVCCRPIELTVVCDAGAVVSVGVARS